MRPAVTFLFLAVLLLPVSTSAQVSTATVNGTIADESKLVLPGVTVTATDLETGRQYVAVSDERGVYRLVNMPPGAYKIQAELGGFATAEIPHVELLVGQNATLGFVMKLATIAETLTVISEAPLVDVRSSQVAGYIDRRQMDAVPVQGRNWMELSMLVKGITTNNATNTPGTHGDAFQLNLDGQQIKQNAIGAGSGQPRFSREAIAEFQIVTNLFDVTQGRSTGVQVHAISRSGTNNLSGVVYGYFRDDKLNAPDPVANRVLPYSNQQIGGVLGGPIVKDKLHYFFSYENENQPFTNFTQPAFLGGPSFSKESKTRHHSYLGRVDWHSSPRNSVSFRASGFDTETPFQLSGGSYPTRAEARENYGTNLVGTWNRVVSDNRVRVLHVGYFQLIMSSYPQPGFEGVPDLVFPGASLGAPYNLPWDEGVRNSYQFRYDETINRKRHNFKFGGEYLHEIHEGLFELEKRGRLYFTSLPSPPEMARRFPIDQWNNPAAWDLTGLDPITQRFDVNFDGGSASIDPWWYSVPRPTVAIWFGDTWQVTDRFTLNYGVRWDDDWGAAAPPEITETSIPIDDGAESGDFGFRSDIHDHTNFSPRAGFVYNFGGRNDFVIRSGSGKYYSTPVTNLVYSHQLYNRFVSASFPNDGQPGFATDPTRGVTADDILSGRIPVPAQSKRILSPDLKMPYTWQSSIGFQKQLGPLMAIESDLTHWIWYNQTVARDPNLFFDPVTGYNVDPRFGRPNPAYSQISWYESIGKQDYLALSSGFTRRLQNNFQAGATHTLMFYQHDDGASWSHMGDNSFDRDAEWARSTSFQRNTVRLWAMYQFPLGLSVSGVYFYGSGNYYGGIISGAPYGKPGTNRLNIGAPVAIPEAMRDRWEGPEVIGRGEVAPRNALRGTPLHKVDLRIQEEIRMPGTVRLQLVGEVFNLFNHKNFGSFVTQINNARFGEPNQNLGNAYVPRSGQVGLRLSF
jgi:Carboxypeptidase regulatory-like domain